MTSKKPFPAQLIAHAIIKQEEEIPIVFSWFKVSKKPAW
jgi:hypothetical protein